MITFAANAMTYTLYPTSAIINLQAKYNDKTAELKLIQFNNVTKKCIFIIFNL